MESFRLYKPRPVSRTAADYIAAELASFREAFRPRANRYRVCRRVAEIGVACLFGCMVLSAVLLGDVFFWTWAGGVACIVFVFIVALANKLPDCPACGNWLGHGFGRYCPECATELESSGRVPQPYCPASHKMLRFDKHENFKIRFCTYCRVPLDELGL